MADINNILFPTDFSENTSNALAFALEIAHASGAKVHLMHSIEEPYNFAMMDEAPITTEVKRSISQTVKKLFDNLENDIRKDNKYSELNIETSIQTGRAVYSIPEEASNRNADLVVVGAKGRTGLKKNSFRQHHRRSNTSRRSTGFSRTPRNLVRWIQTDYLRH